MGVAELGVRISLIDSASAGFGTIALGLGGIFDAASRASSILGRLSDEQKEAGVTALSSGLLFAGFASALKWAVDNGAELQDAMMRVSIAVDGADQSADQMKNTVINLADYSVFSLSEVADGFVALGEKGQNAQAIMGGVGEASINLAEALNSKLVPASNLLATSMQLFGAKADQAKSYSNALTFAFYNGIPSVQGLQQAITNAGGMAASMGIKFDDFVVVLDALGRAMGDGSKAGTSLRYMLGALSDPTSKAQKELADLGILVVNKTSPAFKQLEDSLRASGKAGSDVVGQFDGTLGSLSKMYTEAQNLGLIHTDETFFQWAIKAGILSDKLYDTHGNFIGLQQAVILLGKALDGLPDQQKVVALQQLFNVRAGQGADSLLKNLQGIQNELEGLQKKEANTSAAKDADKVTGTLSGTMKELGTTFQSAGERIGSATLGPLTGVGVVVNNLVHAFVAAPPQVHTFAASFLAVGTVLTGLIFAVSSLRLTFLVFWPVIEAMAGPVGLLVAGVLLLAVGAALLATHWKQVTDFMGQHIIVFGILAGGIGGVVVAILAGLIPAAMGAVMGFGAMAMSAIAAAIPMIVAFAPFFVIGAIVGAIIAVIILAIRNWGAISHWLQQQWHAVLTWLGTAWHAVQTAVVGVLTGIGTHVLSWINGIRTTITNGFHLVQTIIHNAITFVVGLFLWLYNHNYYFHDMVEGIKYEINSARNAITTVFNAIRLIIGVVFNYIKQTALTDWMLIQNYIVRPVQNAIHFVQEVVSFAKNWLDAQWAAIVMRVHAAWSQFVGTIGEAVGGVKAKINDIVNSIMGPINDTGSKMYNAGHNFVQMLINGIKDMAGAVGQAASDTAGQIWKFLGFHSPTKEGPLSDSDTYMPNMMKMFAGGILQHKHLVHGAMNDVAAGMSVAAHVTASGVRAAAASVVGSGSNGSNQTPLQLVVDSKVIAEVVLDHVTGELRQVGAGRTHR